MLKGQDFVILSFGEVDALIRLAKLVPQEVVRKSIKAGDIGVAQGLNLCSDLRRVIYSRED